jgi:SLOG cluster4 family
MEGLSKLIIIGGQSYMGPTAERDKKVVEQTAQELFNLIGNSVCVTTGGMPGIPDDFARAWNEAGGKYIQCIVSSEHEEAFKLRNTGFNYIIAGKSQLERRLALSQLENVYAVLAIQGGKYTTHELQLFEEKGAPIVTFWGSGGAAGGMCPYDNGYVYTKEPAGILCSTDPNEDSAQIAKALAFKIYFSKIKE